MQISQKLNFQEQGKIVPEMCITTHTHQITYIKPSFVSHFHSLFICFSEYDLDYLENKITRFIETCSTHNLFLKIINTSFRVFFVYGHEKPVKNIPTGVKMNKIDIDKRMIWCVY